MYPLFLLGSISRNYKTKLTNLVKTIKVWNKSLDSISKLSFIPVTIRHYEADRVVVPGQNVDRAREHHARDNGREYTRREKQPAADLHVWEEAVRGFDLFLER